MKLIGMIAATAVLLGGAEAQRFGGQRGGQRGGQQQQQGGPQRGGMMVQQKRFGGMMAQQQQQQLQQRGPTSGQRFGQQSGGTVTQRLGMASGRHRGGRKSGGLSVDTLETCSDVIEFDCALDLDLDSLLDDLREREALREAAKESGDYSALFALEGTEELKATMDDIRMCLLTVKETLPEEDACSVALESERKERGRRGRRGFPLDKIAACADEASSETCGLSFDVYDFVAELEQLQAERELRTCKCGHTCQMPEDPDGLTTGTCQADGQTCAADLAEPTCTSEEQDLVKQKLEQVRQCLSSIKDTLDPESECAIELEGKRPREEPEPTDTIGPRR